MAWKVTLVEDQKFIEIKYSGVVTADELNDTFNATLAVVRKTGILRFYADCSEMTKGHSILDLYYLIDLYGKEEVSISFKEAILLPLPHPNKDEVRFYETACLNRGYLVKIFSTRDEALSWLFE